LAPTALAGLFNDIVEFQTGQVFLPSDEVELFQQVENLEHFYETQQGNVSGPLEKNIRRLFQPGPSSQLRLRPSSL
jgi:hypothetical protein